jgi:hypothetical protein
MLKKLMLLSVVMLTVSGSLQAAHGGESLISIEERNLNARRAAVAADIKASRGTVGSLLEKQVLLRDALDNLTDVVQQAKDQETASNSVYGKRKHDRELDSQLDDLRALVDIAEAEVAVESAR